MQIDTDHPVLAMDWEKGVGWKLYDGKQYKLFTKDQFLNSAVFAAYPWSTLIVEAPHFAPRGEFSVAQIYTENELRFIETKADFYDVTILLFPAKQTVRAGLEGGFMKQSKDGLVVDKTKDAEAIREFAILNPQIPLMYWHLPTAEDVELHHRRDLVRFDMSRRLNEMRPLYQHPEAERFRAMLPAILADKRVDDKVLKHFKVKVINKGRKDERTDVSMSQFMSVFVAVFDSAGKLRVNDQDKFIGVREVLATLWMHAFHGKGGTARSNLIHWGLRAREQGRKNGRQPDMRREFAKAVKTMVQVMRDYGLANGL